MGRRAAFHNLGCRVNAYETEAMTEELRNAGYEIVPFSEGADVYVVNTCTVTNIADRKSRQMLHRAKQMNPGAVVVAVGCYVEDGRKTLEEDSAVDLLVGNHEKGKLPELLETYFTEKESSGGESGRTGRGETGRGRTGRGKNPDLPDKNKNRAAEPIRTVRDYENISISSSEGRVRAFIKIQDGCNQFCTYCMIPYVRGRVRSRRPEDVLSEAERLAAAGYRELILTGIHISSYGMDFHGDGARRIIDAAHAAANEDLLHLVEKVCSVPGVERVRFGSLEPGIMTEPFVRALSRMPAICPQFHLSLQSGSDAVLKRMMRTYNTAQYAEICRRLRTYFENPSITTDLIVGFPGETEEEFAESMNFAEEIGFAKIHIFKYSRRDGTRAAAMPDQIPEQVKTRRAGRLGTLEAEMRHAYAEQFVGKTCSVLIEEEAAESPERGAKIWTGHTRESVEARIVSDEDLQGRILTVRGALVTKDAKLFCET